MTPQEFLQQYEQALAAQSWPVVAPLFHPDVCVTFNDGTYKGIAEVQQAFESTFGLIEDEEYRIKDLHWVRQTDDYAVCLYTFHWRGLVGGKPAQGSGRGTSVLVKEDGRWLLLTEHLGPNPV